MKQCYWNLAGMLHPTKYTRWYTFWCCYSNMLVSSLLPLQNGIRITICDSTRQKTWSYLRHMPIPLSAYGPPSRQITYIYFMKFSPGIKGNKTSDKALQSPSASCASKSLAKRLFYDIEVTNWQFYCLLFDRPEILSNLNFIYESRDSLARHEYLQGGQQEFFFIIFCSIRYQMLISDIDKFILALFVVR